jgi:hypothetical protein
MLGADVSVDMGSKPPAIMVLVEATSGGVFETLKHTPLMWSWPSVV